MYLFHSKYTCKLAFPIRIHDGVNSLTDISRFEICQSLRLDFSQLLPLLEGDFFETRPNIESMIEARAILIPDFRHFCIAFTSSTLAGSILWIWPGLLNSLTFGLPVPILTMQPTSVFGPNSCLASSMSDKTGLLLPKAPSTNSSCNPGFPINILWRKGARQKLHDQLPK